VRKQEPNWLKILGLSALWSLVGALVLLAIVFIFILAVCSRR